MFKVIAVLFAVLASSQAQAWGAREQGALAGIAGTLVLQHVLRDRQPVTPQPHYPPVYTGQPTVSTPPVAQQQPPVIIINDGYRGRACHIVQIWDPTGRFYYGDRQVCSLL